MRIRNFLNTFKNLTDLKLLSSSEYVNYILNHMAYKNRCCYKMFATFDFTDHCSLFMKKNVMLFFFCFIHYYYSNVLLSHPAFVECTVVSLHTVSWLICFGSSYEFIVSQTLNVEVQNSCGTVMCSPCKRGLKTKRDETLSLEEKSISISPRHISCNTSLYGAKTSNRLRNLSCCDNRLWV